MTVYTNIFGGPGTGKSTLAAAVFAKMKKKGYSVELVTEFAKDLVWENRTDTLAIQPYVSMKQFRNLARVKGKVDFVVTDSPLLKDSVYANIFTPELPESYHSLLGTLHRNLGPRVNFLLKRKHKYDTVGRYQSEDEAKKIDDSIRYALITYNEAYIEIKPSAKKIVKELDGLR